MTPAWRRVARGGELNSDIIIDAIGDNRVMTIEEVMQTFDATVVDAWADLNDSHWKTTFEDDIICFHRTIVGRAIDFINHKVRRQVS